MLRPRLLIPRLHFQRAGDYCRNNFRLRWSRTTTFRVDDQWRKQPSLINWSVLQAAISLLSISFTRRVYYHLHTFGNLQLAVIHNAKFIDTLWVHNFTRIHYTDNIRKVKKNLVFFRKDRKSVCLLIRTCAQWFDTQYQCGLLPWEKFESKEIEKIIHHSFGLTQSKNFPTVKNARLYACPFKTRIIGWQNNRWITSTAS